MSYVFDFGATESDKHLLGGKGAGLAEMTKLGLPVPPGFTISTEACRVMLSEGELPEQMWKEVDEAVARLEEKTGRTFGAGPVPLLLSVRSGAVFSMPGMMDTVLNLGCNEEVVRALEEWSGDAHFAWDVYRRFLQMYGDVVLGVLDRHFQAVLSELRGKRGVDSDADLTADDLRDAAGRFKALIREHADRPIPSDPREQLRGAIEAVFHSWNNRRAIDYRRIHGIPDDLGTACNVQMMVFGDLGDDSGTGVCFTRDPATGAPEPFGDYLPRAQGEDVVAGIRNTFSLDQLAELHPGPHAELLDIMRRLEQHYRDMLDIEFTIEGRPLHPQTRVKRTAQSAVRLAVKMVEGLIDRNEAILRVDPDSIEQLHRPQIDASADVEAVTTGVAASPGAAVGRVAFDADRAVEMAADGGGPVILVRPETTPDDIHGMAAAAGILTAQGGRPLTLRSSPAAWASRRHRPAAWSSTTPPSGRCAASDICRRHDHDRRHQRHRLRGRGALVEPERHPARRVAELGRRGADDRSGPTPTRRRRPEAGFRAEGIGLARTEHMFMVSAEIVQTIILTQDGNPPGRWIGWSASRSRTSRILEAMDGLPVVVRLLDPPLHETPTGWNWSTRSCDGCGQAARSPTSSACGRRSPGGRKTTPCWASAACAWG